MNIYAYPSSMEAHRAAWAAWHALHPALAAAGPPPWPLGFWIGGAPEAASPPPAPLYKDPARGATLTSWARRAPGDRPRKVAPVAPAPTPAPDATLRCADGCGRPVKGAGRRCHHCSGALAGRTRTARVLAAAAAGRAR